MSFELTCPVCNGMGHITKTEATKTEGRSWSEPCRCCAGEGKITVNANIAPDPTVPGIPNERVRWMQLLVNAFNTFGTDPDAIPKIADYFILSGAKLPLCKTGDTVWFETFTNNGRTSLGVKPHTVTDVCVNVCVTGEYGTHIKIPEQDIGKSVFIK